MTSDERQARWTRGLSVVTAWLGSFPAILMSVGLVVLWAMSGPFFHFSDTWQLLVNTPTTVLTFWMAFVIQNTQNRDGRAIQTKLDAILDALPEAPSEIKALEDEPEKQIVRVQEQVRGEDTSRNLP
jgi:low affinity Fe/Cu permease